LKTEIESKESNEEGLQERISELDSEISIVCHLVISRALIYRYLIFDAKL